MELLCPYTVGMQANDDDKRLRSAAAAAFQAMAAPLAAWPSEHSRLAGASLAPVIALAACFHLACKHTGGRCSCSQPCAR